MNDELADNIIRLIAQKKQVPPETVNVNARLADLGISSLEAITIVYEIEEKFGIEVPNEVLENLDTVNDVVQRIEGLIEPAT
ncbi:MAG: acyl carrier protein [Pseudomonadota bacterium]|nr:acyl carrier protein [Pseudomonadota bacterium]